MRTISDERVCEYGEGDKAIRLRVTRDDKEAPTRIALLNDKGEETVVLTPEEWERIGQAVEQLRNGDRHSGDLHVCIEHGYHARADGVYRCPTCYPPKSEKARAA
jgi:hypothetical protein